MSYTKEAMPENYSLADKANKILASWDNEDFFDIKARQYLNQEREEINKGWSEVFGIEYNKEIDMHENKDHINPPHYKNVAAGKQYMELMVDMLERFNGVEAHLMGQVYKYLMRAKLKDPLVQDLNKAKWYLDALIKYSQEGKVM